MADPISSHLVALFLNFLNKEPNLMKALQAFPTRPSFKITANHWQFTLPALYEFSSDFDPALSNLSYLQFRKALFHSPANSQVANQGAQIIIVHNKHKVDESIYGLVMTH